MNNSTPKAVLLFLCLSSLSLRAQVCDPGVAPTGLRSTYTVGSGALLEWDVVPGSIGVQIKATSPSGSNIARRIIGFERDQFLVSDLFLTPGDYTWRIQAACSTTPPYSVTPISESNTFTVGGGGGGGSDCPATITDIDGNVYSVVDIGGLCWMGENLKVQTYRSGTTIPTGLSNSAWNSTTNGAYAVYNNLPSNKATYGLLYNWHAVNDDDGLCPTGWRVPSDGEWTQLTDFLGGESVAGGLMKTTGTLSAGTGLWESPNGAATNSSGFSGLPGGGRNSGGYFNQGFYGFWWSSSVFSTDYPDFAWTRNLQYLGGLAGRSDQSVQDGFSVRCVQGECQATVTDIDGNVYDAVQIGSQCWMAENLKVERYRNGNAIPAGLSDSAWTFTTTGAFAVYDDVAANKTTYGLLYNWYAVDDTRGLCPNGWHVPTDAEWLQLTDFLGGDTIAGGKMKTTGTLGAGTGLWQNPNTAATNSSGYSGLPGGDRNFLGNFDYQGYYGDWWSSSEVSTGIAWSQRLSYDNAFADRLSDIKGYGFSVRCLRD
jgi:uncharacterized protein (TIGR02145 family)